MNDLVDLDKQAEEQIEKAYRERSREDPFTFIRGLYIPSQSGRRLFDACMADFQKETFQSLTQSLIAVNNGGMPPKTRYWIERTKKASKDADIAAALLWPACFPKRPLYIQIGAADLDQAAIIKRRIASILFLNDWLNDYVEIQSYKVKSKNKLAEIEIVAADVAGSHGETPDILVVNELSHVTKWEFVENLLDNADGVAQGVVIVATNAGFKGTKAEVMRKIALDPASNWSTHILDKPAPWHSEANLREAKKRNTPSRYKRLWQGVWASGKGDAFDDNDINRIFKSHLKECLERKPGWIYIAGLDLGVSHDHAGIVVLGVNEKERLLRIFTMKWWEPSERTGEIDLTAVEEMCLILHRLFNLIWLGYDPHQAVLMAQRLRKKNVPCREVPFSTTNLDKMANALKTIVEDGVLESYEDPEGRLRRDFGKFNMVEKSYGYKLEAISDEFGHADVGTALAICLPKAIDMLNGRTGLQPEDVIADDDDNEPLSKKEVEELPDELKDIYEACDEMAKPSKRVLAYED